MSRAPKAREAPFLFLPLCFSLSSSCGNRTHLSALKGQYPEPIDERAVCVLRQRGTLSAVGREALESSSAAFQATAKPSQLPTHVFVAWFPLSPRRSGQQKKPDVLVTPGFGSQIDLKAKRHKRSGSAGELPCSDRFRCAQ